MLLDIGADVNKPTLLITPGTQQLQATSLMLKELIQKEVSLNIIDGKGYTVGR